MEKYVTKSICPSVIDYVKVLEILNQMIKTLKNIHTLGNM